MESAELDDDFDPTDRVPMWDGVDVGEPAHVQPVAQPRRIAHGTIVPPIAEPSAAPTAAPAVRAHETADFEIVVGDEWDELDLAIDRVYEAEQEAVEHAPLVAKLRALYAHDKQADKAIAALHKLVELETDSFRKGVYLHAAATVCRDGAEALDDVLDYYGRALDCFFAEADQLDEQQRLTALAAFEAIDSVIATSEDWNAQAARVSRHDRAAHALQLAAPRAAAHRSLRRARRDLPLAAQAVRRCERVFEIAQQLDPSGAGAHRSRRDPRRAVSARRRPGSRRQGDRAAHPRCCAASRSSTTRTRRSRASTQTRSQYDKRWCVCSTLAFLKKADPAELQFYEQYKPRGLVKAKNTMSPDSWAKLAHPDENRYISAIFGACWEAVAAMNAYPHKDFGLKREDRRQLAGRPADVQQAVPVRRASP